MPVLFFIFDVIIHKYVFIAMEAFKFLINVYLIDFQLHWRVIVANYKVR